MVEQSAKTLKPWRAAIAEACHNLPADHVKLLGPVRVEVDFYLRRPPSVKRGKREWPVVPPDLDKLARAALDGISQGLNGKVGDGFLWGDDAQVIELVARKFYDDEHATGAEIRISAL